MAYLVDDRDLPDDVLARVRARREAMLARLEALAQQDGKVLFELQWMTPQEARRRYWSLRWRGWLALLEVLLLFILIFFGSLLITRLLAWLLGL